MFLFEFIIEHQNVLTTDFAIICVSVFLGFSLRAYWNNQLKDKEQQLQRIIVRGKLMAGRRRAIKADIAALQQCFDRLDSQANTIGWDLKDIHFQLKALEEFDESKNKEEELF